MSEQWINIKNICAWRIFYLKVWHQQTFRYDWTYWFSSRASIWIVCFRPDVTNKRFRLCPDIRNNNHFTGNARNAVVRCSCTVCCRHLWSLMLTLFIVTRGMTQQTLWRRTHLEKPLRYSRPSSPFTNPEIYDSVDKILAFDLFFLFWEGGRGGKMTPANPLPFHSFNVHFNIIFSLSLWWDLLTFRHRASYILGQTFHYSP